MEWSYRIEEATEMQRWMISKNLNFLFLNIYFPILPMKVV